MADFQEQFNAILGNPEVMGQISAIARVLSGSPSSEPSPTADPPDFVPTSEETGPLESSNFANFKGPDDTTFDPNVLSGLLGNTGNLDPQLIRIALRIFSEYSAQDNEKAALLAALRPFLREERLEKLEKAEKIARLSRVIRVAIQLFKEEGGHV